MQRKGKNRKLFIFIAVVCYSYTVFYSLLHPLSLALISITLALSICRNCELFSIATYPVVVIHPCFSALLYISIFNVVPAPSALQQHFTGWLLWNISAFMIFDGNDTSVGVRGTASLCFKMLLIFLHIRIMSPSNGTIYFTAKATETTTVAYRRRPC